MGVILFPTSFSLTIHNAMSRQRCWCFTENNPTGLLDFSNWTNLRYAIYQEEIADTGTHHFQGYCEFTTSTRLNTLKELIPTAHWEGRKGTAQQAIAYCKKDGNVGGPYEWGTPGGNQGTRTDIENYAAAVRRGDSDEKLLEEHLLAYAKFPNLAMRIKRATRAAAAPKVLEICPNIWQRAAMHILEQEASTRHIHWFVDRMGNTGKTHFARYITDTNPGKVYYSVGGKFADCAFAYAGEEIVILDYPRSAEQFVQYTFLECLINGWLTISKYESCTIRFPTPKILVFANFEPDKSKLSADRWDIHHIRDIRELRDDGRDI